VLLKNDHHIRLGHIKYRFNCCLYGFFISM